jgi:hypothetical protein
VNSGNEAAPDRHENPWPFDQPRNCTTITVWRILKGLDPITLVTHDADDHAWQFLNTGDGREPDINDAAVVCLEHMAALDPSVLEVADLPAGWLAWRSDKGQPWQREPNPCEEDEST